MVSVLSLLPPLRLMPMLTMVALDIPTPMDMFPSVPALDLTQSPRDMPPTTDTDTTDTMARGPLMLSQRLRLMLRPILLSSMDPMDTPMPVPMVDTEPMVPTPLHTDMDTEPMEPTPTLTTDTERGPLMLSPRLRPRLTPPSSTPPPMLSLPRSLTPASPRSTPASPQSLTPATSGLSSPQSLTPA